VFEYFAQIAHIKPATAATTHQLIGFALRDAICVNPRYLPCGMSFIDPAPVFGVPNVFLFLSYQIRVGRDEYPFLGAKWETFARIELLGRSNVS
jgi:hypothetical protein